MAALPAPRAMVNVGPPLFCSGPSLRFALDTSVAQALVLELLAEVSKVTMLLVAADGVIRFTVPGPS